MDILGHDSVQKHLCSMLEEDRLHHCLLFEGPTGLGKSMVAQWLTKLLMCENPIKGEVWQSCDQCFHCGSVERNEHPNFVRVQPDRSMKVPKISVDVARNLIEQVSMLPRYKRQRVVLIEDANCLTDGASNALLKTLEEPSTPTIFILVVTSANFLLTTVRSRSQKFRFAPVSTKRLKTWLSNQGIDPSPQVLSLAQGCPGRALSLLQGEIDEWLTTLSQVLELIEMNLTKMFALTKDIFSDKSIDKNQKFHQMLDILEMLLRDVLVWQTNEDPSQLLWSSRLHTVQQWAGVMTDKCIGDLHRLIEQAREDSIINVNVRLQLEALLVMFKRAKVLGYI